MRSRAKINIAACIILAVFFAFPFCSKKEPVNPPTPPPTVTKPVANFTANKTNADMGEAIQFTDQSTNTPTSWAWDFGDGNTSTSKSPSHTYTQKGVYTVSLTSTNSAGSGSSNKADYISIVNPDEVGVSEVFINVDDSDGSVETYNSTAGTTTISFTGDVPDIADGSILTVDVDTMGYLRKVVSTTVNGNTVTVETEKAYFQDVFVDREFTLNTSLIEPNASLKSNSSSKEISRAFKDAQGAFHPIEIIYHQKDGSIIKNDLLKSNKASDEMIIDISKEFSSLDILGSNGDNVHLSMVDGDLSFASDVVVEFDFEEGDQIPGTELNFGQMTSYEFYVEGNAEYAANLSLEMNAASTDEGQKLIYSTDRITVKFMVGIVPLWVTFDVDVYARYTITSDASIDSDWGYESDFDFKIGGTYDNTNDEFTPINEFDPQNVAIPLDINGSKNLDVHFEIFPVVETEFYGYEGPYAEVASYTEAVYSSSSQNLMNKSTGSFLAWDCANDVGLDYRIGTDLYFIEGEDDEFGPINVECFKYQLWSAPHDISLVNTVPEEATAGSILPLTFKVVDLAGDPVENCSVILSGDGAFSETQIISNGEGQVSLDWTIQATAVENTAYAKIYNSDNELIKQVEFTTTGLLVSGLPTVSTTSISSIAETSASGGGNITSDGGASVSARGICWSTDQLPTVADDKTMDGTGTGTFTSSITDLSSNTTYYVRAYATNSNGTAYGAQVDFATLQAQGYASLTTTTATSIASTTATSGGNISANGGSAITSRGLCWSTADAPTPDDEHTTNGTGIGAFESQMTGLVENTTYYYRAYAINSSGVAYGAQKELTTTPEILLPSVQTSNVTDVDATSAVCGGEVTDDGRGTILARGVCYNTSGNPTVSDDKTTDGTGVGTFTSNITGLNNSTTYYVRAYATNSAGTTYGEEKPFTTTASGTAVITTANITEISNVSAKSGGNFSSAGGLTITHMGVCWSTNENPTINDGKTQVTAALGAFESDITDILPNTTYYVRAYVMNNDDAYYGEQKQFTSLALPVIDYTTGITQITLTTAKSGGIITNDGGSDVIDAGVCWSTSSNPTIADSKTVDWHNIGSYSSNLTGLSPSTTYYVRAYATNSSGTSYGDQKQFSTVTINTPTVTATASVTEITSTSAVSGGTVTENGGASITERGICWGFYINPTIDDSKTASGTGTGSFAADLTNLTAQTIYYVRAYATNSAGTAYGPQQTFTTDVYYVPSVNTSLNVTDVTNTTATAQGDLTDDGNRPITARGMCWSTSKNPTLADNYTEDGTDLGLYSSNLTGLTANTVYYIRAYATNSEGTAYGNNVRFYTMMDLTTGTFTDPRDSYEYSTVELGSQTWFSENLRYDTTASYIVANESGNLDTYGRLYEMPIADSLCPSGWHLPSVTEWNTLITYLGGDTLAGGKMKEAGTSHWYNPNTGATNQSGFTALPGDSKGNSSGSPGYTGRWWTSTPVDANLNADFYYLELLYNQEKLTINSHAPKANALSVRCIKD